MFVGLRGSRGVAGGGGGVAGGGGIRCAYARAAGRAVCGARIQSARAPEKHPPELGISLPSGF